MLDAYIIEKIKKEQERDKLQRQPARIERPQSPARQPPSRRDDDREPGRGVVIIEF
mgnify:CR=1 FL=1